MFEIEANGVLPTKTKMYEIDVPPSKGKKMKQVNTHNCFHNESSSQNK